MFKIIKSDFYRILRGKALYVAIGIMIIMFLSSIIGMSPGHIGITSSRINMESSYLSEEIVEELNNTDSLFETREIMKKYGKFELDKQILGANANLYYIFIVVVAIILVTDLSSSTAKNTLSSEVSRKKYYFSKLFGCLILSTILILFNNFAVYFLNILINGVNFSSSFIEILKITLMQLPLMYGIISLLVCIGMMFRKMSVFNGITIPLIMLVQLIILGVTSLLHINSADIMQYEFQYVLSSLAIEASNAYIIKCVLLGIIYFIIFNIIGYYSLKKAEIR